MDKINIKGVDQITDESLAQIKIKTDFKLIFNFIKNESTDLQLIVKGSPFEILPRCKLSKEKIGEISQDLK